MIANFRPLNFLNGLVVYAKASEFVLNQCISEQGALQSVCSRPLLFGRVILLLSILLIGVRPASAQQKKPDPMRAILVKTVIERNKTADIFVSTAIVEDLQVAIAKGVEVKKLTGLERDKLTARRYFFLVIDLYSQKQVKLMAKIGRYATHFLLQAAARHKSDAGSYSWFRNLAQMTSFNLSMNCWPGWNDKGIQLNRELQLFGLEMAKLDQRLVREAQLPAKKKATSTWAIAIHLMALGRHKEAAKTFKAVINHSKSEGNATNLLMYRGYEEINEILSQQGQKSAAFDKILADLDGLGNSDAKYFVKQLLAVLDYFQRSRLTAKDKMSKPATK